MPRPPDKQTLARLRAGLEKLSEHDGERPAHAAILELAKAVGQDMGLTVDMSSQATLGQPLVVLRPRQGPPPELSELTKRELEVARLVAKGMRNKEIAALLHISLATVKDHVHKVLRKAGVDSRTEIAALWPEA